MLNSYRKLAPVIVALALLAERNAKAQPVVAYQFVQSGTPTAAYNFTPTLGKNVQPLFPSYLYSQGGDVQFDFDILANTTDKNGDYNAQSLVYGAFVHLGVSSGSHTASGQTEVWDQGIAGAASWNKAGDLYLDGGNTIAATHVTGFTGSANGVDSGFDAFGLQTSSSITTCTGNIGAPDGPCILAATTSALNVWTNTGFGAEQVTTDYISNIVYALDEDGQVWMKTASGWLPGSETICDSGRVTFTQIAAKTVQWEDTPPSTEECVFGLSNGTVYITYGGWGSCWLSMGADITFKSIAADNATLAELPYGLGYPFGVSGSPAYIGVWATDSIGRIFYFDWSVF
jgi:hypothetical protein